MPCRDEIVAPLILLDTVYMEIIKGRLPLVALCGEGVIRDVEWEMVRRAPLEEQFTSCDINLLKDPVVKPTQGGTPGMGQIRWDWIVNSYQSGPFLGDEEFVQVAAVEGADWMDFVPLGIG